MMGDHDINREINLQIARFEKEFGPAPHIPYRGDERFEHHRRPPENQSNDRKSAYVIEVNREINLQIARFEKEFGPAPHIPYRGDERFEHHRRPPENQSNDRESAYDIEEDREINLQIARFERRFQRFFNRPRENPRPITIPVSLISDSPQSVDQESINGPEETHKLSITIMDWSRVSAKDLLLLLNPFLSEGGRILSVAIYPGDDVEGVHAVVVCDSSATADYLYRSRPGIESEFERCSNKLLDFKFIPDSVEFIQPPRDFAAFAIEVRLTQINQL